ncbi:MAG: transposase [Oscillatoriaceae cyanobacterium Prado104]|nr:transposase [Oscillatoriaceae cyanobacterium Prado104]
MELVDRTQQSLKGRVFECSDCGFVIDRDLNAAINLQKTVS